MHNTVHESHCVRLNVLQNITVEKLMNDQKRMIGEQGMMMKDKERMNREQGMMMKKIDDQERIIRGQGEMMKFKETLEQYTGNVTKAKSAQGSSE